MSSPDPLLYIPLNEEQRKLLDRKTIQLLQRKVKADGKPFAWLNRLTRRRPVRRIPRCECYKSYWEEAGPGCKDEVTIFRHEVLYQFLILDMRRTGVVSPDRKIEAWMPTTYLRNGFSSWIPKGKSYQNEADPSESPLIVSLL